MRENLAQRGYLGRESLPKHHQAPTMDVSDASAHACHLLMSAEALCLYGPCFLSSSG